MKNWAPPAALGLITWVAYYFHFKQLGLYEDDYYLIGSVLDFRLPELLKDVGWFWTHWPQGRPIQFSLPFLLSYIGSHLGGLPGVYVLAALIVAFNAVLAYIVFRRLGLGLAAIVGALAFLLFPADTTHGYLTHAAGLQPSLTFLLLATLAYLSDRKLLAYAFISAALLTYESTFAVFLAVPLLARPWRRRLLIDLARHAVVLGLIILVDIGIRTTLGDTRLALGLGPAELVQRILSSLYWGPWVSATQWAAAPVRVLRSLNLEIAAAIILAGGLIALWLGRAHAHPSLAAPLAGASVPGPSHRVRPGQLAATGLLMWALAYALSFTHFPPTATVGRPTSVHLAAALGASLTIAALVAGLLPMIKPARLQQSLLFGLAAYFGLLVGYGVLIQQDLVRSWLYQRQFWREALPMMPALEAGTVVIVNYKGLPDTHYILSHTWETTIALRMIYDFPELLVPAAPDDNGTFELAIQGESLGRPLRAAAGAGGQPRRVDAAGRPNDSVGNESWSFGAADRHPDIAWAHADSQKPASQRCAALAHRNALPVADPFAPQPLTVAPAPPERLPSYPSYPSPLYPSTLSSFVHRPSSTVPRSGPSSARVHFALGAMARTPRSASYSREKWGLRGPWPPQYPIFRARVAQPILTRRVCDQRAQRR